jgi:hypothetical protein
VENLYCTQWKIGVYNEKYLCNKNNNLREVSGPELLDFSCKSHSFTFVVKWPSCLVGIEACGSAHH